MSSTGAGIPYQFRTNKFIDRQIFFNFLERYSKFKKIEGAGYVSMGAYSMVDHSHIYRRFGINRLYSFDGNPKVIDRAKFNRPINACICETEITTDVASKIHSIRSKLRLDPDSPLLIWFDYTSRLRKTELDDLAILLPLLSEGDVVRFTFNANPRGYTNSKFRRPNEKKKRTIRKENFRKLYRSVGLDENELPNNSYAYRDEGIPKILTQTIDQAALEAMSSNIGLDFDIVSAVHYKDSTEMISVTGVIIKSSNRPTLNKKLDLKNWPFKLRGVHEPLNLSLKQITLREYLTMDSLVASNAADADIVQALGFEKIDGEEVTDLLPQFRMVSRFYPSFLAVSL